MSDIVLNRTELEHDNENFVLKQYQLWLIAPSSPALIAMINDDDFVSESYHVFRLVVMSK